MVRPENCEHLSAEQVEQLEAVARATGKPGLLSEICARGAEDTESLEKLGVRFKADVGQPVARRKQPQSLLGGFLEAAGAARTQEKAAPQPPDVKRWEAARAAAHRGGPDVGAVLTAAKAAQKPGTLSPRGEALAQQVAVLPEMVALRSVIEKMTEGLTAIQEQQAAASRRLDILEGRDIEGAKVLLFPGGNGKAGSQFDWGHVQDVFGRTE